MQLLFSTDMLSAHAVGKRGKVRNLVFPIKTLWTVLFAMPLPLSSVLRSQHHLKIKKEKTEAKLWIVPNPRMIL